MYPLTPLYDVRLTRNHDQIVQALQGFEGRKYNYEARNTYEQQYSHYPTTTVEMIRNDVSLSGAQGVGDPSGRTARRPQIGHRVE